MSDGRTKEVVSLSGRLAEKVERPLDLGKRELTRRRPGREQWVGDGGKHRVKDAGELTGGAHVDGKERDRGVRLGAAGDERSEGKRIIEGSRFPDHLGDVSISNAEGQLGVGDLVSTLR